MGNKFEVWVWEHKEFVPFDEIERSYHYVQYWHGQSFFKAIYKLLKAKSLGYGCVKLEYR